MLRLPLLRARSKYLLALAFFLSALPASGQAIRPLIGLEFPDGTWKFPEKVYFQDLDHDLDKFLGDWAGSAYNGDSIFLRTSVATQVWSDFYHCAMDRLMLDLRVFHQGKRYPSYEERDQEYPELIQGAWFFSDMITEYEARVNPNKYLVRLAYTKEKKEDPYSGSVFIILELSEDEQVMQVRRWSLGVYTFRPKFPPYITPEPGQVMWTLRRVAH